MKTMLLGNSEVRSRARWWHWPMLIVTEIRLQWNARKIRRALRKMGVPYMTAPGGWKIVVPPYPPEEKEKGVP